MKTYSKRVKEMYKWLLFLILFDKGVSIHGQDTSIVQRLHKKLFDPSNYDKNHEPTSVTNKTVSFGIALIHLDVQEKESIMITDLWLRIVWNEPKFAWEEKIFGNISALSVACDTIWKPDITLWNNAHTTREKTLFGNTHARIFPDGDVLWVPPATLKSYCKLNLRRWPMDNQICKMQFGSWTHDGDTIRLKIYNNRSEVDLRDAVGGGGTNMGEWNIVSTSGKLNKMKYACCKETYYDIEYEFNLERRSHGYKVTMVAPCLVLMMLTIGSFLLTPNSGEKLWLNGVSCLGSMMYLIYITSMLPFHQNNVPLIVILFANTLVFSGIAILLNIVSIRMVRIRKLSSPPMVVKNTLSGVVGTVLCLGTSQVPESYQSTSVTISELEGNRKMQSNGSGKQISPIQEKLSIIQEEWNMVAVAVERFSLFLYIFSFFIIVLAYV